LPSAKFFEGNLFYPAPLQILRDNLEKICLDKRDDLFGHADFIFKNKSGVV